MRAAVATLLVLVLALAATGGEARAGDGRHLLGDYKPEGCKNSNCNDLVKYGCDWLPKSDDICSTGGTVSVPVRNCLKKKCGYVSISLNGKCYKYKTFGDYITKLDLKCGDKITIFAWDKHLIKGDGSKPCIDDSSRLAGHDHCKTCHFEAQYKCYAKYKPGDECRKAYGDCDLPAQFDKYCKCPDNGYRKSDYMCRNSTGVCNAGAFCTGYDKKCPDSKYAPDDTVCRNSTGPCDSGAKCYHGKCPDNTFLPKDTKCRDAKGVCDKAAFCTGYAATCPPNDFRSNKTCCREAHGKCDEAEFCTGSSADCPADVFKPKDTLCRKAYGLCDKDAKCTGYTPKCPDNGYLPRGTVCRPADKDAPCDADDTCSGYDHKCEYRVKKAGELCRTSAGPCDAAEYCDGYSKKCPPDFCGPRKPLIGPYCPVH